MEIGGLQSSELLEYSRSYGFETGPAGRVQWRKVKARTRELIEKFEIPASPNTLLGSLSRAAQTQAVLDHPDPAAGATP